MLRVIVFHSRHIMTSDDRSICPVSAQSKLGLSRTQVAYWRPRLDKNLSKKGVASPNYSVRVTFQNRRVRFPLNTPNKEIAASTAAKIFTFLVENGWEETLMKYKPTAGNTSGAKADSADTVGDLIAAAFKFSTARASSLRAYSKAFRRIVSQIVDIPDGKKYESKGGHSGNAAWQAKVDAVKLSEITPQRVQAWKAHRLEEAGRDTLAKRRTIVTVNSLIRNSKALFSKKLLPFIRDVVSLPSPLPFEGLTMERPPSVRYRSQIDASSLIQLAIAELKTEHPEAFKIFVLALLCGLRVSEIDFLLWSSFDFAGKVLLIRTSEYHQLKSEDSEGDIDLSDDMNSLFQSFSQQATGQFVIESEGAVDRSVGSYRCQQHISFLNAWLREKGVTEPKPIHTLRKEVGATLASEQGIYAASRYLRHSDIRITAAIYADKKNIVIPSIAQDLT